MITSLRLQKFRSYKDESFEFGNGVNIIVGPNASGKTNLLEAILVLCNGKSFRSEDALIMRGKPWGRLDGVIDGRHQRVVKLTPNDTHTSKKYELDSKTFTRLSTNNVLPAVLFEPNHLQMLHGSPDLRREFLDDLLSRTDVIYDNKLRQYRRALSQRNSLLKHSGLRAKDQIFVWNIRLGELGGYIAQKRRDLIAQLDKRMAKLYPQLSDSKTKVKLSYDSKIKDIDRYGDILNRELERRFEVDCERGFTTIGPHRDDLAIIIKRDSAQEIASRGELRTILLALKISETELIEKLRGQNPLLLLDDVFSELDGSRRRALTDFLRDKQSFITTTDADVVTQHFTEAATIIPINSN